MVRRALLAAAAAALLLAAGGCDRAAEVHPTCRGHGGIASVTLSRRDNVLIVGCRDGMNQDWRE